METYRRIPAAGFWLPWQRVGRRAMNGMRLVQNRRVAWPWEAQDMDLAVDAFRDGDNRLAEGAAGEEQLFAGCEPTAQKTA